MSATHEVRVLCNGRWTAPGTVIRMHPYGCHDPVEIVQNWCLVRSEGFTCVIDGGLDGLAGHRDFADRERLGPTRDSAELLAGVGVDCAEIDLLILTHLHYDHYANARLFPHARIVVNAHELAWVLSPANRREVPRVGFPRDVLAYLIDDAWERLDAVTGTAEVAPGLRVIETGGHSPGHQIALVDTGDGPVVVPGDEIYLYANLDDDVPIGYFHDFARVSAAMDLLTELRAPLIPAHDPAVLERYPGGLVASA